MKLKISTTTIIITLSAILILSIAYSFFYKVQNVVFLNKTELSSFLIKDEDDYHKSFHEKDLTVRKVSSIDEYEDKIRNSTVDFSLYQKEKTLFCVEKLNKTLINIKYPWFDGRKAIQTPWKFGSIEGTDYENGLPHTRGDVIILPKSALDNYTQGELIKLILHEKIHIYQKMYPRDVENYIQHNKYYKFKKRGDVVDSRANPDLNEWVYNDFNNRSFIAIYNSNPTTITDVIFYPNNNSNSEHPFEQMAYEMSQSISTIMV